jgi:hypothetical protein
VHRNREVDDGDVHLCAADDVRHLVARLGAKALDSETVEEDGELVCEGVLAPAAVGEQEIEAAWVRGRRLLSAGGTRARVGVEAVEAQPHEE